MNRFFPLYLVLFCVLFQTACKKDPEEEKRIKKGIAFVAKTGNSTHLWGIGTDESGLTKVIPNELGDYSSNPAFSSDGRTIFFLKTNAAGGENGVYSVKPNGEDFKKVLTDDASQKRNFYQLAASYDAEHLVFSLEIPRTGRKVIELYRACPCGNRVERITNFETAVSTILANTESYAGSFSPDSKYLYFCQSDPSITGVKDIRIYKMEMATQKNELIKIIRAADVLAAAPSVSPNLQKILVSIDENIFVMNRDGSSLQQVGNLRGYHPIWENNNDFYFSSNNYLQFQPGIYRSNFRFTKVEPMVVTPGNYIYGGMAVNNTYP